MHCYGVAAPCVKMCGRMLDDVCVYSRVVLIYFCLTNIQL